MMDNQLKNEKNIWMPKLIFWLNMITIAEAFLVPIMTYIDGTMNQDMRVSNYTFFNFIFVTIPFTTIAILMLFINNFTKNQTYKILINIPLLIFSLILMSILPCLIIAHIFNLSF